MRIIFLFLTIILLFSCSVKESYQIGKSVRNINYTDLEGEIKPLRELFDVNRSPPVQEVVVVFWSMYCNHSRNFLKRINKAFKEQNPTIRFLFVNLDDLSDLEKLKNYISVNNLTRFDHAFSGTRGEDETYLKFGSPSLPKAYILNQGLQITGIYS